MNVKLRERAGVVVIQTGQMLGIGTVRIPFGVLRGKIFHSILCAWNL